MTSPELEPHLLETEVIQQRGRVRRPLLLASRPKNLGAWGEWVALRYVRRAGWDVLARNWKGGRGELDLVAYDGPFLAVVEIKTRRIPSMLPPEDQVTRAKERKLDDLVMDFVLRYELTAYPVRIDVITVETPDMAAYTLRHYKGWNAYRVG